MLATQVRTPVILILTAKGTKRRFQHLGSDVGCDSHSRRSIQKAARASLRFLLSNTVIFMILYS